VGPEAACAGCRRPPAWAGIITGGESPALTSVSPTGPDGRAKTLLIRQPPHGTPKRPRANKFRRRDGACSCPAREPELRGAGRLARGVEKVGWRSGPRPTDERVPAPSGRGAACFRQMNFSSPGRFRLVRLLRAEPVFARCAAWGLPQAPHSGCVRPASAVVMRPATGLPAGSRFASQTPPGAGPARHPVPAFARKTLARSTSTGQAARAGRDDPFASFRRAIRLPRAGTHPLPPAKAPSAPAIRCSGRSADYPMERNRGEKVWAFSCWEGREADARIGFKTTTSIGTSKFRRSVADLLRGSLPNYVD